MALPSSGPISISDIDEYTIYSTLHDKYELIASCVFYKDEEKDVFMAQKILNKGYVDEVDRDNPQSAYIVYNDEVFVEDVALWNTYKSIR